MIFCVSIARLKILACLRAICPAIGPRLSTTKVDVASWISKLQNTKRGIARGSATRKTSYKAAPETSRKTRADQGPEPPDDSESRAPCLRRSRLRRNNGARHHPGYATRLGHVLHLLQAEGRG